MARKKQKCRKGKKAKGRRNATVELDSDQQGAHQDEKAPERGLPRVPEEKFTQRDSKAVELEPPAFEQQADRDEEAPERGPPRVPEQEISSRLDAQVPEREQMDNVHRAAPVNAEQRPEWVREIFRRAYYRYPPQDSGNAYSAATRYEFGRIVGRLQRYGANIGTDDIINYAIRRRNRRRNRRAPASRFGEISRARAEMHNDAGNQLTRRQYIGSDEAIGMEYGWIRDNAPGYYNVTDQANHPGVNYRERLPDQFESEAQFDAIVG